MKKSMLALAVLGSFAGVAAAQSSVTLFGVVDLSVLRVKNSGGSQTLMMSNSYNSNRLGFRGVEDLGGGMKAGFWLEAGMNNDTGAIGTLSSGAAVSGGTKMFNRRSTVSLMGNFGEVRLGRDYTPQFWTTTIYDAFGTNGPGSSLNIAAGPGGLGTGAGTFVRADNSVGYFLPAMGGLFGQVQVSGGENATNTNSQNKHTSFRVGYAAGPVSVALASGSTTPNNGGTKFKVTNLGGSFDLGAVKLMGYVNDSKAGAIKERLIHLGGSVPMGQAELRAGYTKSDGKGTGVDTRDASQLAVGLTYNLSKRTALYTDYSRVSNKSGAAFTVGAGAANAAGQGSTGFDAGIRHAF